MHNIVILDGHTLNPGDLTWNEIEKLGKVTLYPRTKKEEIIERIEEADIIIVNKVPLNAAILEQANQCKCICVTATGYNNIDIEMARKKELLY